MPRADKDELLEEAAEALDEGDPRRALRLADEVLASWPRDPDALQARAEALLELDRPEEAEEVLARGLSLHPAEPGLALAAADLALELHHEEPERVRAALETAARAERVAQKAKDEAMAAHLAWVQGRAHSLLEELRAAAEALGRAHRVLGDDFPDLVLDLAIARFEVLQFDQARPLLERLVEAQPDDAEAVHYLGLIAEREGRAEEAERHFARARRLSPESYPRPIVLPDAEFDRVIEEALEKLPEKVRTYLANVPVMVEDLPAREDLEGDPPLSPLSLGMFRGHAVGERSVFDPWTELPSSILLFKRNLERYATSREELVDEIEQTLLHEVGHFVGWDEDELRERGLD